jgi:hypothetical protein
MLSLRSSIRLPFPGARPDKAPNPQATNLQVHQLSYTDAMDIAAAVPAYRAALGLPD